MVLLPGSFKKQKRRFMREINFTFIFGYVVVFKLWEGCSGEENLRKGPKLDRFVKTEIQKWIPHTMHNKCTFLEWIMFILLFSKWRNWGKKIWHLVGQWYRQEKNSSSEFSSSNYYYKFLKCEQSGFDQRSRITMIINRIWDL